MNSEKGQALPLAILALTIGTLLIVPFLGHAGSSIIGSGVYAQAIDYRTACDAGVEHAIWKLLYDDLGDLIPDPGDQIVYQLPESINGAVITVTVTSNATGVAGVGSITKTIIDSFDFEGSSCDMPDMIHISGNIYAIAYEGPGSNGFVRTVEIALDGNITNSAIDTLEFDTDSCASPRLVHVAGDTYAIAYTGDGNDGYLKTVSIASNGAIGDTVLDFLEFNTNTCYEPDIVHVTGIYFAIVYRGQGNDGFCTTVSIASDGDIGDTVVETWEFNGSNCYEPDIIHISGTYFAIAYRGPGNDGFCETISIASNGDITNNIVDSLEFNGSYGGYPYLYNLSGDVYAVVYTGSGSDGYVSTMTISSTGDISGSVISEFEFDAGTGEEPQIINIVGDTYAIVYRGPQNDGHLITLPIESNGNIPGTIIDSFEYDTSNGYSPNIISISDGIVAIAYCIPSSLGSLVTIGISTSEAGSNVYRITAVAGDTTIQAQITSDNTSASIVSWQVQ